MNCMKCGRETKGENVFCEECLAEMEKYPVKPGTVVQLPRQEEQVAGKRSHVRRKAPPSPEEQVKGLRKIIRVLVGLLIAFLILLTITGYFAVEHLMEEDGFLPGQNYSAISETLEPSETSE